MTKLLQQCFLFFIVVVILGHNLGNSQVSVNRTIGPTLVDILIINNTHLDFCFLSSGLFHVFGIILYVLKVICQSFVTTTPSPTQGLKGI